MKGVIEMAEEQAKEEYTKYKDALKDRVDKQHKQYEEIKKVYYSLSKGNKVIDIFDAFKKTGVNEEGEPKLAICQANAKTVFFQKQSLGSSQFADKEFGWDKHSWAKDIILPSGTFPDWKSRIINYKDGSTGTGNIIREKIKTGVPIIPAQLLPEGKLENFYILWEVKDWQEAIPPKGDPYLLKRISTNLFSVLAEWDVTEIERAVLRGHQEG